MTLYAEDPEWADVKPIPQNDGNEPLAPIFYSEEYKDTTDYFRGVVATGEMSQRVLKLTEHLIRQNPAHYSAWQYRYRTLVHLKSSLAEEFSVMDELAIKFMKTYQVWHHRQLLVELRGDPGYELRFIETALEEDPKNYHTWAYRQWILAHFDRTDLWEGEVTYVERLLMQDVRNNSAWNHRFFVLWLSGAQSNPDDRQALLDQEIAFAKFKIATAPSNTSPWNYLRGVLDHTSTPYSTLTQFVKLYTRPRDSEEEPDYIDLDNPGPSRSASLPCGHAIEFLADIFEAEGNPAATELWQSLAKEHDPTRSRYWKFRSEEGSNM